MPGDAANHFPEERFLAMIFFLFQEREHREGTRQVIVS